MSTETFLPFSQEVISLEKGHFDKIEKGFTSTKSEIYQKYTRVFIDAWSNQDFRDFRHLHEIERFLDIKRNLNKKRKVEDLRYLLDKFYSLYSSWSKFFPSSMERPALLKKRVLIRSKFFSQLLRSFEGLVKDVVGSLKTDTLENNNFQIDGSFNFVDISLEHQLKLNHKLRKVDKANHFAQNASKRDAMNYIFKDSVNISQPFDGAGPATNDLPSRESEITQMEAEFYRLMGYDNRFISKDLPHPVLNLPQEYTN